MNLARLVGGGEPRDGPFTPTAADVYQFARERALDEADARDWWEHVANGEGEPPGRSWQGSMIKFCASRRRGRTAEARGNGTPSQGDKMAPQYNVQQASAPANLPAQPAEAAMRRAISTYLAANNSTLAPAQLEQFVAVSTLFGLNPLKNEIYATTLGGKLTLITGVYAYVARAQRHPAFDGFDLEFVGTWFRDGRGGPELAPAADAGVQCTVHRKGVAHPVKVTAWLCECRRNSDPWRSKPSEMLRKCAVVAGLRLAFADVFSGMPYVAEEMPPECSAGMPETPEYRVVDEPAPQPAPQPAPHEDPATSAFLASMEEQHARHPAAYSAKLALLGVTGPIASLPPERRREVFLAVRSHVEAVLASEGAAQPAAQPQPAPPFAGEFAATFAEVRQ